MAKILFVGDTGEYLSKIALTYDYKATLVNYSNWENFLDTDDFVGYTSLGDLSNNAGIFYKVCNNADKIIYRPPTNEWSDNQKYDCEYPTRSRKGYTEHVLRYFANFKNIDGLNFEHITHPYLSLVAERPSDNTCLWAVGCSYTAGYGLDFEESYGSKLAKKLDVPVIKLAERGSSISWAADQILRSDVRGGDFVVWGLTNEHRLSFWENNWTSAHHVVPNFKVRDIESGYTLEHTQHLNFSERTLNELLVSEHIVCDGLQKIFQVMNFCDKLKAKLLLFGIAQSDSFQLKLSNIKQFFPYHLVNLKTQTFGFLDLASDNQHPGSIQHSAYADFCYQALKKLNYI